MQTMRIAFFMLLLLTAPAARAQFTCATNTDGTLTITAYTGPGGAVAIPASINGRAVTGIGAEPYGWAFWDCPGLTSVSIGTNITSIDPAAFLECPNLTAFIVDPNNPAYSTPNGILFDKAQTTLLKYPNALGASYAIPDNVTGIGVYAFLDCTLTNVTIGANVTSIGAAAFESTGLTGVTLPNRVTSIGNSAFLLCPLANLVMNTNVTSIGIGAFQETSLTNVTIPPSVNYLGGYPFASCSNLTAITVAAGNPAYVSVNGVLFDQSLTTLIQYPAGLAGGYAIPGGVNNIGEYAFYGAAGLTNVVFPNSVTSVGQGAFMFCNSLPGVTIPAGVTNLAAEAFLHCPDLTAVYFQGNAPAADSTVFYGDSGATAYCLPGTGGWDFSATIGGIPVVVLNPPNPDGSLQVTLTPAGAVAAGAQWQVDGGLPQPSGSLVVGLSVGTHTVSFSPVSSWAPPANQTVSVSANGITFATGTYLLPQPQITVQPVSQCIAPGGSVTFSVTAGGAAPLNYAWYQNGAALAGATNASYTINQVPLADSGSQFFCVLTNAYGSVTSSVATLTVGVPPIITNQPTNVTVWSGGTATFTVAAAGTGPLEYQWQFNGINLPGASLPGAIITTVAGGGTNSFSGDGGPAINASLNWPTGVAADPAGNLLIADTDNNRIRQVNPGGLIVTVAGGGPDYPGDLDLVATGVSLFGPLGVTVDAAGNLFIGDSTDHRVCKVYTNGLLTTVAGDGSFGYSGDGGPAIYARLDYPDGVAVDASGNLFIADTDNDAIRRVATNGIISTLVGNASLNCPSGVALDASGNLFIADSQDNRIYKVDPNELLSVVAGIGFPGDYGDGGPATNACLDDPAGVAVDAAGNLYIADAFNSVIRRVDAQGFISTVAGNGTWGFMGDGGPATNASLFAPEGVAVDAAGNLFIADSGNNRIRKLTGGPTLTLPQAGPANAGNYDVVVTSPYGSVTSSVVSLTVALPRPLPGLAHAGVVPNAGFHFAFTNGQIGQTYTLQASTNLVDWVWLQDVTSTNALMDFYDPQFTNYPRRFYRVQ
jgi:sugar lactone lactonase YvrE